MSMNRQIFVVAIEGNTLRRVRTYDLSKYVPADDQLNSALPDWKGRLWFVTRHRGIVGVLNPRTGKLLGRYRTGEAIGNSFAMDETGGVFVVTDRAQYRFDLDRKKKPRVSWRFRYDNIKKQKPGQFDAGSGTTPTLMGKQYLSIADNATPHAGRGPAPRQASEEGPAAARLRAARLQEGRGRDRELDHRHGHGDGRGEQLRLLRRRPTPPATATRRSPASARVDIKKGGRGCRTVWNSQEISPSTVPKLSLATGLVYMYTKPPGTPDKWYVTAVDFRTGKTVWRRLIGTGVLFNVHYAGITIGRQGVLYAGVLGGTVALRDG